MGAVPCTLPFMRQAAEELPLEPRFSKSFLRMRARGRADCGRTFLCLEVLGVRFFVLLTPAAQPRARTWALLLFFSSSARAGARCCGRTFLCLGAHGVSSLLAALSHSFRCKWHSSKCWDLCGPSVCSRPSGQHKTGDRDFRKRVQKKPHFFIKGVDSRHSLFSWSLCFSWPISIFVFTF